MNNEFYQHKRKDKVKWIIVFTAIILLAASVIGVATEGFTNANPYRWFDGEKETENPPNNAPTGTLSATATKGNIIKLSATSTKASSAEKGSVKITATVTPANFGGTLNWIIDWVNPNSDFARGKNIFSYVTLTVDDTLNATVTLKQPFGEQIKVSVMSSLDPSVRADCFVDYRQKLDTSYQTLLLDDATFFPMYEIYNDMTNQVLLLHSMDDAEQMCMLYHNQRFTTYFGSDNIYTLKNETYKYRYIIAPTQEFHDALVNAGLAEGDTPIPFAYGDNYDITPAEIINALGCEKILPTSFEDTVDTEKINTFNAVANGFNLQNKALDIFIEVTTDSGVDTVQFGISFVKDSAGIVPTNITLNDTNFIL